jgi:beta-lactamase regulating signal transducer with metallopeptidase domain
MIAPSPLLLTQADSARAIASMYTVSLLATLPLILAAILGLVLRRAHPEARALVWRSAVVALLVVFVGRQLPHDWIAWVVPSFFATPLIALGRLQVGATEHPGTSASLSIVVSALFVTYLIGIFVVLVPTVVASWRTRRRLPPLASLASGQAARSTLLVDPVWRDLVRDVSAQLGVRRTAHVFVDPAATVAMTWGFIRPIVVLPSAACTWTREQQRIVLMHELAHVRSGDWLFHVAARVVCALFWFHPGVWWLARALRDDCELACDDRVIASGVRRSDYAELLVQAAEALSLGERVATPALALSRRRGLRERLAAVLDVRRDTRPLARAWAGVAIVLTFGVATPTSLVQLAPTRDVLTGLMRDAQWESRAYAVLGLAKRADSVAVARSAAELDPNPRVRAWARYALAQSVVALREAGGSDR